MSQDPNNDITQAISAVPILPGVNLGPYHIDSPIGQGGMGHVFRATDTRLGRSVAVKILSADSVADPENVRRFIQEARSASALNHPNIVTVHDIGESAGRRYIVMELVSGNTLRSLAGNRNDAAALLPLFSQMAKALSAAHAAGIIHRDLKPENIMVRDDGFVKILDFGLARLSKIHGESEGSSSRTTPGQVMGTVKYMSPEQARGDAVAAPSDIFSLGMVFYELAAGRHPFKAESMVGYLHAITSQTPDRLTGVPDPLADLIARMLQKEPALRPTASQVAEALAAIESRGSAPAFSEKPAPPVRTVSRKWIVGALAVVILAGALFFVWRRFLSASGGPAIRAIAVLPLADRSGDPKEDYFAEGMTDELTAGLANIRQLRVISRGSAMQFQGAGLKPAPEIARLLNVDAIVEGSVQRSGDKVRVTIELVDAHQDNNLWAKTFERSSGDVLALQSDLASAVAREIRIQLTPGEANRLTSSRTVMPAAYDAYLKGRYFFNRPSDENLAKAIAQFEQAVRLDPGFPLAYSGLSDAYLWAGYNEGFITASKAKPLAQAAAQKAVELDPNSGEAHTSLATFKLFYEYDWPAAEEEFRRAIALNPNYAFAHDQFALLLAFRGRYGESVSETKRAIELDPLSPQILLDGLFGQAWQNHYDEAKDLMKRAADLDPTFFFAPWGIAWIELEAGRPAQAIPEFEKAQTMDRPSFTGAWLGYAYGAAGDRRRALAELAKQQESALPGGYVPAFNLALIHLGLGDRARALDYLEQAYANDSQWLNWLNCDRVFDPLRREPRFIALMKKLKFVR